jgi:hypothetical protein
MDKSFDDTQEQQLKSWLDGLLHEGNVIIEFEKKDGTTRRMKCTLNQEYISENYVAPEKKTDRTRTPAVGVLSVFDVDINEWRSIRVNSILAIEFEL